jgi:hypothetical protein
MATRKKSAIPRVTTQPSSSEIERARAALTGWKPAEPAPMQVLNSLADDINSMIERGASSSQVVAQLANLGISLHTFRQWRKAQSETKS